ncbi:MAG: ComF family protein [Patescibacteria group bacterium]|nr:ComF family protein [Patescibacteria group bacterium]
MAYESETVKRIIHSLKYEGYYLLSRPIAKLMSEYLKSSGLLDAIGISGFILVPIPLHPSRLKERGYNQSALISRELGAKTGMPVYDVLSRKRKTKEQAEIKDTKERLKNVSGCFILRKNGDVKGKNILLVDDVFTSGATMFEAARVLYRAGAAKVFGLAAAKA